MKKYRRPEGRQAAPVRGAESGASGPGGWSHRGKRGAARKDRRENEGKGYEVEVRRVGTGYRVHQETVGQRRFDVGYADRKRVTRPAGVEATRDGKNTSVVVKAGDERRKKPREQVKMVVMNAVAAMEKVRPASAYTGSGVVRAERVGKRKLKSTKSTL